MHYYYEGKEVPYKVDSETGEQTEHGKGKCKSKWRKPIPPEIIDAVRKALGNTNMVESESDAAIKKSLDGILKGPKPPPIPPIIID